MIYRLIPFLTLLISFSSLSQNDSISRNHFSFSLVNGVSLTQSKVMHGSEKLATSAGIFHGLNFQYTHNFNSHFSASAVAGFGFLPVTYKVDQRDTFGGTSYTGYFSRIHYQIFSNLALSAAYRNRISAKYDYQVSAGIGVKHFGTSYFGIGGSSGMNQMDYAINGQFYNKAHPYLSVGAGIIRKLRNKDELFFRLSYEQLFNDVYGGNYSIYNNTSSGRFYNRGSNLNLALGYTFTGSGKKERVSQIRETGVDKKAAKKIYRKEIRYIDPKSMFVSLSAGIGFGENKAVDPGNQLRSGTFASFVPRATFEMGIGKNFFAEGGFNTMEFWSVTKMKNQGGYMASGSTIFYSYQTSLGAGFRLIAKNNYNIINLHAGMAFGFTNLDKGYHGQNGMTIYSYDTTGQQQQLVFQSNGSGYATKTFITSVYLGASKDFRLTRNLYFTLGYRFHQGFYKLYEEKIEYTSSQVQGMTSARISVNGSSHVFQGGFKVKIK